MTTVAVPVTGHWTATERGTKVHRANLASGASRTKQNIGENRRAGKPIRAQQQKVYAKQICVQIGN